jgi:hypothetical protein
MKRIFPADIAATSCEQGFNIDGGHAALGLASPLFVPPPAFL